MGAVHSCSVCFHIDISNRVKATYYLIILRADKSDFTRVDTHNEFPKIYREYEELMQYFGFSLDTVNPHKTSQEEYIIGTGVHLCEKCFKDSINLELKEGPNEIKIYDTLYTIELYHREEFRHM